MKVVILAGGSGTRLWPVSRKSKPKQVQPFIGSQTLLQTTYRRQLKGFAPRDIFISTSRSSYGTVRRQLPRVPQTNLILEPAKRDTAAAIGLAAISVASRFPEEVMLTVGSDHFIQDEKEYIRIVRLAERIIRAEPEQSLLIGVRPTYPETGYGYIKINKLYKQIGSSEIFYGQKFIEKPDLPAARRYASSWDYLWNTNMFCWQVSYLLELFKKYLPAHFKILERIRPALGTSAARLVMEKEYPKITPISIDFGIMEKTKNILVIPADFKWADVGHWRAVKDILARKPEDNVVRGPHVIHDSQGNLLYSYTGKLIATAGLRDTIVIDTADCLLVCPRDRAQDVKKIVEQLEQRRLKRYL